MPEGVFQMVQGTREAVESLCDHPKIPALTFVGSSPVAKIVYERCRSHHKKVIALGELRTSWVMGRQSDRRTDGRTDGRMDGPTDSEDSSD